MQLERRQQRVLVIIIVVIVIDILLDIVAVCSRLFKELCSPCQRPHGSPLAEKTEDLFVFTRALLFAV